MTLSPRWFKTTAVSSEGLGAPPSCCWLWQPKWMTYSPGWWRSKNARVRISGILGFNSLVRQTLKNNILSLRTLLVELINVTSSKSDFNRVLSIGFCFCVFGSLHDIRSIRERGRRGRQMRWLSLHSRKLIDDNDKEELFTLCKANSLIDK